jgi:hypothetical protein
VSIELDRFAGCEAAHHIARAIQCDQTNAVAQRRHLHLNSTLHISLFTLERSDFAGAQRRHLHDADFCTTFALFARTP